MSSSHEREESPDNDDTASVAAGIYPAEYADRPWRIPGYGSQLKIGKLEFVPARGDTDEDDAVSSKATTSKRSGLDVKNVYLSIVLGKGKGNNENATEASVGRSSSAPPLGGGALNKETTTPQTADSLPSTPQQPPICPECHLPITSAPKVHDTSLAHLCSLPHQLPPHHYPRSSMGLRYLEEQGWDAEARVGLGVKGREGISAPIKVKEKRDRLGVGVKVKEGERKVVKKKEKKLGAKEARLETEREARIRREMLRYMNN